MAASAAPRAKRADAVRNRERVIAAAASVLAELGSEASVDDVAARAGVGRATVYRCFPTKEHLVAGVAAERLRRFERLVTDALEEEDSGAAFRQVLVTIAESQPKDRIMLGALQLTSEVPAVAEARQALRAALGLLMERAKAQGRMRRDATPEDVRVLFSGLVHSIPAAEQHDPERWRRYANLIADALGPTGA